MLYPETGLLWVSCPICPHLNPSLSIQARACLNTTVQKGGHHEAVPSGLGARGWMRSGWPKI